MSLVLLWLYLHVQDALWGIWGGGDEGSNSRVQSSAGKRKTKAVGQMCLGKKQKQTRKQTNKQTTQKPPKSYILP